MLLNLSQLSLLIVRQTFDNEKKLIYQVKANHV